MVGEFVYLVSWSITVKIVAKFNAHGHISERYIYTAGILNLTPTEGLKNSPPHLPSYS